MPVNYTTSQQSAMAMVEQWYGMVPSLENESPDAFAKDAQHWVTQIQQDGSHTAFLNFASSIASQHPDLNQSFLSNIAAQTKATGAAPWTPPGGTTGDAKTDQLPGTNTKSGGAIIGSALTSPVGKAVEDVVAGVIDVVTDGAATPLTTAGLVALQGGGAALEPGSNFGTIAKGAIGGAAGGVAAGGAASLLSGALGLGAGAAGGATAAGGAGVDVAGMTPAQMAAVGDASAGTAADTSAVDWAAGLTPAQMAAAGNAGGTGASAAPSLAAGAGGAAATNGLSTADLLKLGGSALTAGTNYAESAAQLAERAKEFAATNALNTQNTAVNEGNDAVATQNKLNTAPLADQSQYMLQKGLSAPPAPFQPRDYTQPGGTNNLLTPATGGAAGQLAANRAASASYTPGAGGVDTSALQLLLAKLKGSGSAFGNMPTTPSTQTG